MLQSSLSMNHYFLIRVSICVLFFICKKVFRFCLPLIYISKLLSSVRGLDSNYHQVTCFLHDILAAGQSRSSNQLEVPQANQAMEQLKFGVRSSGSRYRQMGIGVMRPLATPAQSMVTSLADLFKSLSSSLLELGYVKAAFTKDISTDSVGGDFLIS